MHIVAHVITLNSLSVYKSCKITSREVPICDWRQPLITRTAPIVPKVIQLTKEFIAPTVNHWDKVISPWFQTHIDRLIDKPLAYIQILFFFLSFFEGILIVHQVPSSNQRQLSSPGSEYSYGEASIPSRETRYKKRLDTQSVGSTLPNRYRTNEKKQRRLVKVDEDNLSFDGSETSSGIASPDGARSPVFPPDFSPSGDNFFLGEGKVLTRLQGDHRIRITQSDDEAKMSSVHFTATMYNDTILTSTRPHTIHWAHTAGMTSSKEGTGKITPIIPDTAQILSWTKQSWSRKDLPIQETQRGIILVRICTGTPENQKWTISEGTQNQCALKWYRTIYTLWNETLSFETNRWWKERRTCTCVQKWPTPTAPIGEENLVISRGQSKTLTSQIRHWMTKARHGQCMTWMTKAVPCRDQGTSLGP